MKKFAAVSIVTFFVVSVGLSGWVWYKYNNKAASVVKKEQVFEVSTGRSLQSFAAELEHTGFIRNANFLVMLARIKKMGAGLRTGEYLLDASMTPSEILNVITSGRSIERSITVSEGLSIYEVADLFEKNKLLSREQFLKIARDKAFIKTLLGEDLESLEGYLFPETYHFTKFTEGKVIIAAMVKKFLMTYDKLQLEEAMPGWSRHQVVTLASIIEKETGSPTERPLISSVFHNRLRKGMLLQTDPTVIYGMAEKTGHIVLSITRADLLAPTRYNTYVIKGLPPGPISNPGSHALESAVRPEATSFLYFVSRNDGTHIFSETYEAHQKAVRQFQLDPKARQGKSWRDLKNTKL